MSRTLFQALAIAILLLSVAVSIRRFSRDVPFKKYWFAYVIAAWCMGCLLYGVIFFIDAPYHQNTAQTPCVTAEFCGKRGTPHTRQEFESFLVWQNTLIVS